ncbi:MAG: transcriptional regulator [Vicinamibacterales bacterium]
MSRRPTSDDRDRDATPREDPAREAPVREDPLDVGRHDDGAAEGRFAYEGLDRVLHEKARLGILTSLVTNPDGLRFSELKALCALTDGNLNRHLEVLRAAGLVEVWKGYEGRRPQTAVRLTPDGRRRFTAYLEELERVVRDALPGAGHAPGRQKPMPPGWQPA